MFEGQKIHGIVPNSMNKLAIFGANLLKIVEFDFITSQIVKDVMKRHCADWIFALEWLNADTQLATIFAQNFVSLWCSADLKLAQNVGCTERCTLYSATLVNDTWNNLYVFSGTVFGQILIWKPAEGTYFSPVIWRLEGHDVSINLHTIRTYIHVYHTEITLDCLQSTTVETAKKVNYGYILGCYILYCV